MTVAEGAPPVHEQPCRKEIWWVNLDPILGRELMGDHMCVVLSDEAILQKAELAAVVPITSHPPRTRVHVPLDPKLDRTDKGPLSGSVLCDQVRTISTLKHVEGKRPGRFRRFAGTLSTATMLEVEDEVRNVLGL